MHQQPSRHQLDSINLEIRPVRMRPKRESMLKSLRFDNRQVRLLPIDPETSNFVRDPVKDSIFSLVEPKPVRNPRPVVWSKDALALLGLAAEDSLESEDEETVAYLAGNAAIPGTRPAAHCYCGYQFGSFAGQLGDGATMYLGEVVNESGDRWELQFKGAGPTPYSRRADGRKVLRSSLREFLCSEAMDALGIPTTRAGSTVTSDSLVERDVFYTGDVIHERCTVITRIAKSFLRFGSFEIFKGKDSKTGRAGPSTGNQALLFRLVDYVCRFLYADIHAKYIRGDSGDPANGAKGPSSSSMSERQGASSSSSGAASQEGGSGVGSTKTKSDAASDDAKQASADDSTETTEAPAWNPQAEWAEEEGHGDYAPPGTERGAARVLEVYEEICRRTARLVAGWQLVGWCHGVLNTDNMSILGLTIDYGPFGFMDRFDREYICNHSDDTGRYAFENQPPICRWNLEQLGIAWAPAMPGAYWKGKLATGFDEEFGREYRDGSAAKLGMLALCGGSGNKTSVALYESLLDTMQATGADFTNTFQALAAIRLSKRSELPAGVASLARGSGSAAGKKGGAGGGSKGEEGEEEKIKGAAGAGAGAGASMGSELAAAALLGCPAVSDGWELLRRQLCTASELADAAKPRMPKEQLQFFLMLLKMQDPRVLGARSMVIAEAKRWQQYEKLQGVSEEAKAASDRALWAKWIARYLEVMHSLAVATAGEVATGSGGGAKEPDWEALRAARQAEMERANPKYILRNYIAQAAVHCAEKGDFSEARRVLARVRDPFGLKDGQEGSAPVGFGAAAVEEQRRGVLGGASKGVLAGAGLGNKSQALKEGGTDGAPISSPAEAGSGSGSSGSSGEAARAGRSQAKRAAPGSKGGAGAAPVRPGDSKRARVGETGASGGSGNKEESSSASCPADATGAPVDGSMPASGAGAGAGAGMGVGASSTDVDLSKWKVPVEGERVALTYDCRPPGWACKLKVSCSS